MTVGTRRHHQHEFEATHFGCYRLAATGMPREGYCRTFELQAQRMGRGFRVALASPWVEQRGERRLLMEGT